jgi:hypothetical protein
MKIKIKGDHKQVMKEGTSSIVIISCSRWPSNSFRLLGSEKSRFYIKITEDGKIITIKNRNLERKINKI